MKTLAARHVCNHVLVQELALRAALTATLTSSPINGDMGSKGGNLYKAAEAVARSHMAVEEELTYSRAHNGLSHHTHLGSMALAVLQRRVAWLRQEGCQQSQQATRAPGTWAQFAAPPGRFVALYGSHAVLPPLPAFLHAPVSYGEASRHLAILQALLGPLGFQVSLNGLTRAGCPIGPEARFIIALTREAAAEIAAAKMDDEEVRAARPVRLLTEENASQARRPAEAAEAPNPLPRLPSPTMAAAGHADGFTATTRPPSAVVVRSLRAVPCLHAHVVAIEDVVTATVAHRYRRAIQALHNSGYIPTGADAFKPATTAAAGTTGVALRTLKCSARYDPASPAAPPPFHIPDSQRLQRLRLHRLVLDFVPSDTFLVRRFFQTGPAAFTAHVTLRALEKGLELNMNGLFYRTPPSTPGGRAAATAVAPQYNRVMLRSERELLTKLGMPYVDPIGRGIYCQEHSITMASQ